MSRGGMKALYPFHFISAFFPPLISFLVLYFRPFGLARFDRWPAAKRPIWKRDFGGRAGAG